MLCSHPVATVNSTLRAGLVLFVSIAFAVPSYAEDAAQRDTIGVERRFEIRRHERLIETRHTAGSALAAFVSDGCSGGLSAVWASTSAAIPELARTHGTRPPWENCCVAHDRAYHTGGPFNLGA